MSSTKTPQRSNASSGEDANASSDGGSGMISLGKIQLLLLCCTMMGMGVIFGYVGFVSIYDGKCTDSLDGMQKQMESSKQDLKEKYLNAVEEHRQCLEDTTQQSMQNNGQANMQFMAKHEQLLEQHSQKLNQLANLQTTHTETIEQVHQLQAKIDQQKDTITKLESSKKQCQASKQMLRSMLEDLKSQEAAGEQQGGNHHPPTKIPNGRRPDEL